MKFYMIYSNQYATGNKPIGIASLSAILKKMVMILNFSIVLNFQLLEMENLAIGIKLEKSHFNSWYQKTAKDFQIEKK